MFRSFFVCLSAVILQKEKPLAALYITNYGALSEESKRGGSVEEREREKRF